MSMMMQPEPQRQQELRRQREKEQQARQEEQRQEEEEAAEKVRAAPVAAPTPATGGGGHGGTGVRTGGGRSRGEGRSMSAVMDELLGGNVGAPLSSAGPASARVVEAVPREAGQSFLAGVFWWLFTRSEAYRNAARRLGASRGARPVVVCHADGTRFNLLLLDPHRRTDWAAVQLEGPEMSDSIGSPTVPEERLDNLLRRADLNDALEPTTLFDSVRELVASSQFGVAVVSAPQEIPTCAVSPAVPILSVDNTPLATLGAFLSEVDPTAADKCVATTVDHALRNGWDGFTVDCARLDVISRHHASDSCLLRVKKSLLDGRQQNGLKGPLRITPNLYRFATFDGASSGPKRTRISSFDPAIVDPDPDELARVYTEADTARGDSGAALIDGDDFIVGFARRISGYDSPIQYSSWTSAVMVYMAHNLFDRVALGA